MPHIGNSISFLFEFVGLLGMLGKVWSCGTAWRAGVMVWIEVVVVPISATARSQATAHNYVTTKLEKPHPARMACCKALRLVYDFRAIDHGQQKQ